MIDTAPLWQVRIRTPRLELRLPDEAELDELFRVAAAGIHPPDEMPFAVPWTDDLQEASFKEHHHTTWESWSPEEWRLNLVTFLDGRVIGSQGIEAKDFAERREVETGSWLGARFQRRGYGIEQRAAVVELAFRGLAAEAAKSGALIDNVASQRISDKLGYEVTSMSELAPRGTPIPHYNYRLEHENWHCPIAVEIDGLEPALPLFGA